MAYIKLWCASLACMHTHKQDGKVPQNQTFVDVTEATANVNYIIAAVQHRWGSDHLLATSDGLQLNDSFGTHGQY